MCRLLHPKAFYGTFILPFFCLLNALAVYLTILVLITILDIYNATNCPLDILIKIISSTKQLIGEINIPNSDDGVRSLLAIVGLLTFSIVLILVKFECIKREITKLAHVVSNIEKRMVKKEAIDLKIQEVRSGACYLVTEDVDTKEEDVDTKEEKEND